MANRAVARSSCNGQFNLHGVYRGCGEDRYYCTSVLYVFDQDARYLPTWAREYTKLCRHLLRTVCPAAMFMVLRCLWLACLLFTPLGPDHLAPWWNIVLRQVVDDLCYW